MLASYATAWGGPCASRLRRRRAGVRGQGGRFGRRDGVRYPRAARRIRLVAYGARLESVLGESPRGFESPILRVCEGPATYVTAGHGPFAHAEDGGFEPPRAFTQHAFQA